MLFISPHILVILLMLNMTHTFPTMSFHVSQLSVLYRRHLIQLQVYHHTLFNCRFLTTVSAGGTSSWLCSHWSIDISIIVVVQYITVYYLHAFWHALSFMALMGPVLSPDPVPLFVVSVSFITTTTPILLSFFSHRPRTFLLYILHAIHGTSFF